MRGVYLCLDGRVHTSHPVVYAPLDRSLTLSPSVFLSLYLYSCFFASLSLSPSPNQSRAVHNLFRPNFKSLSIPFEKITCSHCSYEKDFAFVCLIITIITGIKQTNSDFETVRKTVDSSDPETFRKKIIRVSTTINFSKTLSAIHSWQLNPKMDESRH